MLDKWLLPNDIPPADSPKGYKIFWIKECDPGDGTAALEAIRKWIRFCYASEEYVVSRIGAGAYDCPETLYQCEKFPASNNIKVRHGDFGEAIGHFLLEEHPNFSYWLPIYRLRHKDDREKARFGFDLIGFSFADGGEKSKNTLCIGETKVRTSRDDNVIADGYETVTTYSRAREIEQTGRIATQLFELGKTEDSNRLAIFSEGWAHEEFERCHVFIGVFDASTPFEKAIEKLNNVDKVATTFTMCLVIVDQLADKIRKAYQP